MLVVGCGSHAPAATGGRGELPRCVDAHPAASKPMSNVPVRDARFTRTFSLDHGDLRIEPTEREPGISYQQARCTFLSAATAQNLPSTDKMATAAGMSIGLGLASVRSTSSYGYLGGATGAGLPTPPPVRPYGSRLAWVAVIRPELISSCPGATPTRPRHRRQTPPDVTGDQVLLLDAQAGADGMIYAARSPGICFGGSQPAFLAPLVQSISVPWTMARRSGGRVTITASARPCDGIGSTANADWHQPSVVQIQVQRPVARCGSPTRRDVRLLPRRLDEALPRHLVHAPVGALDVFPR